MSAKKQKKKAFLKKVSALAKIRGVTRTQVFAEKLRAETPKSEQWFQSLWMPLKDEHDEFNIVFGRTIPDCINHKFKYVIEIDGSVHKKKSVVARDTFKDRYYAKRGYELFRLTAYDAEGFAGLCELVERHRAGIVWLAKRRLAAARKTLIRRNGVLLREARQ